MKTYKLCDCFENLSNKLTKHYENKGEEVIEPFEPNCKMWLIDKDSNGTGIAIQFESKVKRGTKSCKVVKSNISASHCPFCGKSMVEEIEDMEDHDDEK